MESSRIEVVIVVEAVVVVLVVVEARGLCGFPICRQEAKNIGIREFKAEMVR